MNEVALRGLETDRLAAYLSERLSRRRLDPPLDPRTQEEPPSFVLRGLQEIADPAERDAFHAKLAEAIRISLLELGRASAESPGPAFWADSANDEWLAGLCFIAAEIEARQLLSLIEILSSAWLVHQQPPVFSLGLSHLVRALASLQDGPSHGGLWQDLWTRGPRELRPLFLFGWARCNPAEAMNRVPEMVAGLDELHLPAAVWSLLAPGGLSATDLGRAVSGDPALAARVREALIRAGADTNCLRDYDLGALPATPPAGAFPFDPDVLPGTPDGAVHFFGWDVGQVAA